MTGRVFLHLQGPGGWRSNGSVTVRCWHGNTYQLGWAEMWLRVCPQKQLDNLKICNTGTDSSGGTGRGSFPSCPCLQGRDFCLCWGSFCTHGTRLLTAAAVLSWAPPWPRGFGDQMHVAAQWDALVVILPRRPDGIHPEAVTAAATVTRPSHLEAWAALLCETQAKNVSWGKPHRGVGTWKRWEDTSYDNKMKTQAG